MPSTHRCADALRCEDAFLCTNKFQEDRPMKRDLTALIVACDVVETWLAPGAPERNPGFVRTSRVASNLTMFLVRRQRNRND